jgi:ABC-type multidrug transport system fused ATPase/permease subunit
MTEINKTQIYYSEQRKITETPLKIYENKDNVTNLPKETEIIHDKFDIIEENLMFEYKHISPFKLYYYISGKMEIFLMIIATLLTIGAGCSNVFKPKLLGDAINNLASTQLINKTDDEYEELMDSVEPKINKTIKQFLIFGSFIFVLNFLSLFLWLYSGLRQMHKLKIDYFSLVLKQEQGWFDQNNTYQFAAKIQAQLEGIEQGVGERLGNIILKLIEIISGYVVGFQTSWQLTLILSACSVPFIIAGHILMRYGIEKEKIISIKSREKAGGIAEEILYNIKTITSFANFDYEIKRFNKSFESGTSKKINSGMVQGFINLGIYLGFTITCIYARKLVESDYNHDTINYLFTAGDVVKVLVAVRKAIISMVEIPSNIITITESCASASDYFTLYERIPEIYISTENLKPNRDKIKGRLEFKNIKFSYPDDKDQELVLNGLDLVVEEGKKVALVGESGCGKSTTVNLIERLYEPNEGEILLDGINIKEYNIEHLRSLIGYVEQEPVLFNKSIRKNIIFGREEKLKELGDIDILLKESCIDAYIQDFIEKIPNKYEYKVGFKGNKLLAGQKQRISIARALLLKPKIIILDEATSSLDNEAEQKVQKALDIINKKKITTIIIGNRLNIIKNADMIYALYKGKVKEKGTHEQLMAKKGYYAGIIKSEMRKKIFGVRKNKMKKYTKSIKTIKSTKSTKKIIQKITPINYSNLIEQTVKFELEQKEEDNIEFKICEMFKLINDKNLSLFIGILTGLIYGAIIPSTSLILGKLTTAFSLPDNDEMYKQVLKWSLILLLITFIGAFSNYFKVLNLNSIGSSLVAKIRKKLFRKYLELHMGFFDFDSNNPNGLLSILMVEIYFLKLFFNIILGAITVILGIIITALIIGFYYDWKLSLILLCFFPLRIIFSFFSGKYKVGGTKKNKEIRIEANNYFSECVTNTKTIFSFNFQNGAIEIYKSILDKENKDYIKDSLIFSVFISAGEFLSYVSNSVAYKCAMEFIRHKTLTFATMNNVKKTLMSYIEGTDTSIRGLSDYSKVKIAYKYVFKILNTPSEINSFEDINKDKISAKNLKGKIEFKNVTFSYPTKPDLKVLNNVSFIIPRFKRAAIVGNSESGKSTIIQLIERFYDINEGEILIDDINIKDYNLYELRKKIGLISQEPMLFKRGLYENILYGNLEASRNDVFNVANKAALREFLNEKEFNLNEKSSSQGEKQRISIARTFLKNPAILLLDDATSSLDHDSEKEIRKKIIQFQKGRTSVYVTHRLSNIINYDIIFFMDKGTLVEQGNHNELIEKRGNYYNLYIISEK